MLANFDIFKDSGGEYIADVKSFSASADSGGKLKIAFTTLVNNALVSGIDVLLSTGGGASPSPSPSAPPVPNTTASVPLYDGCNIGTPGDAYNRDVTSDPVDPNSAAIIASQQSVDTSNFATETYYNDYKVNLDEGDTATKYPVTGYPFWHPDLAGNWPWAGNYFIEANGVGDAHAFVLDSVSKPNGCKDYESYLTAFDGSMVHWNTGTMWDLSQPYENPQQLGYPDGSSEQASGLSLFRGLALLDQVAAGNLNHAINFDAKVGSLGNCYITPASQTGASPYTGTGTAHQMCFGTHLRLHASFNSAPCASSPQAAHIVYGLMHFGGYESDTGNDGNGIYPGESNTTNTWDIGGVQACLATIRMTDFDVLVAQAR